jgi:hypothetical protein
MQICVPCGTEAPDGGLSCAACGEASWAKLILVRETVESPAAEPESSSSETTQEPNEPQAIVELSAQRPAQSQRAQQPQGSGKQRSR